MKTETNIYLCSLVEKQRADLLKERDRIIDRINGATMPDDEFGYVTFRLSEICREIREAGDAITALRSEESQKQLPALSEKTVELTRHLLEIYLESANKLSGEIKYILSLTPVGEKRDKLILDAKTKVDEAATALNEFNAAYPKKPKSK